MMPSVSQSKSTSISLNRLNSVNHCAPKESYAPNEESFFFVATDIGESRFFRPPADVMNGIEALDKILALPVDEGKGFAVLCNLYFGTHVFVIEKRSNSECMLFQSHLVKTHSEDYSFGQFLIDPIKHTSRTPDKLIRILRKILSYELPLDKRVRNYAKIFFSDAFRRKAKTCPNSPDLAGE